MSSFFNSEELKDIGLKSYGQNVLISRKASIYSPEIIEIGDNVRIDDFCVVSGKISIGNYVHINPHCGIFAGTEGVKIGNYVSFASKVTIYAISDDYSGEHLTSTMIPSSRSYMNYGRVKIGDYSILGVGVSVLHGVNIEEGTAVGAMSLMTSSTKPWSIYVGTPARFLKERSRDMLKNLNK